MECGETYRPQQECINREISRFLQLHAPVRSPQPRRTTAKTRKQPRCPSAEGQAKETGYTCAVEYSSGVKRNEIMPFAATWMDLEIITLNEISQTQTPYHLYVESKIRQN